MEFRQLDEKIKLNLCRKKFVLLRWKSKSKNPMPNYDYRCETCDHLFEVFQSMSADKLTDCPLEDCDGKVKRLLGTGGGIIFKGDGFYETDYRSKSYKEGASKDQSS